jgi:hypothetical protein
MIKPVASVLCLQVLLLVAALATPGDDLLVAKLPKDLRNAAKVPEGPLVQATKDAVKGSRSLAPQITAAAAVRRATDCASAEAVLRAALHQLVPTPTAMELFALTRAAIGAAPHDEGTTVNTNGQKVASASCTEALLAAAASEYPDLASVLNDSGKQVAQKQVAGEEEKMGNSPSGQAIGNSPSGRGLGNGRGTGNSPSSEPGAGGEPAELGVPLIPPAVTFPPTGGGLVSATTPITAGQ